MKRAALAMVLLTVAALTIAACCGCSEPAGPDATFQQRAAASSYLTEPAPQRSSAGGDAVAHFTGVPIEEDLAPVQPVWSPSPAPQVPVKKK